MKMKTKVRISDGRKTLKGKVRVKQPVRIMARLSFDEKLDASQAIKGYLCRGVIDVADCAPKTKVFVRRAVNSGKPQIYLQRLNRSIVDENDKRYGKQRIGATIL